MCGIFGIVSKDSLNRQKLLKINNSLKHRGPNDSGLLMFDLYKAESYSLSFNDSIPGLGKKRFNDFDKELSSAFLHRRLSIIDLSKYGHQPMGYSDGNYWITYNGEIYNYIEIKKELQGLGYYFKSNSDTEVILASYKKWGTNCVSKFNGMWAFAIADLRKNIIFLSRDRIGIKPLFYYYKDGQFIFSSEQKAIIEYLDKTLTLNKNVLQKYLFRGQLRVGESEKTLFSEIMQLCPGNNLLYNGDSIKKNAYWTLKVKQNSNSFAENVEKFKYLFNDSMRIRLRSDVEVGSCLSGGLDSSSIVSAASYNFNKKLHTFSAIWPGEKCDESYYINQMKDKWDIFSHSFTPDLELFLDDLHKIIWHQEIPLEGPSIMAQWAVMKKVKEIGIKVILDGQGADEILSGYPYYLDTYYYEMIKSLKFYELYKYKNNINNNKKIMMFLIRIIKNRFRKKNRSSIPIIDGYFDNAMCEENMLPYTFSSMYEYNHHEITNSNLPNLLHYEDRNSMAHSVESRVPFLDHRLVEFALSIPVYHKINGDRQKVILREGMKNILPEKIYNRHDKIGFETPIEEKLLSHNGSIHKSIIQYIKESKLDELGVDVGRINETDKNKWFYFSLLSLSIYKNKFFD